MNPEIKALWIADLRANAHLQGHKCLKRDDKYCCLGRLCELHRLATNGKWKETAHYDPPKYLGQDAMLPIEVIKWAGLYTCGVRLDDFEAWQHNDGHNTPRLTFPEIADLIEKHL